MFYSLKKQQGLTMISLMMLLIVMGAILLLMLKIVPIYITHGKVRNAMESITHIGDIELKSKSQIMILLNKRLTINSVYDLPKNAIKISKHGHYIKITAKYNVKEQLVANLNALVEFDEMVEMEKK